MEHINAEDVIAFCLYLINKCRGLSLLAEECINTNEVIGFCLHLLNNVRWSLRQDDVLLLVGLTALEQ